MAWIAVLTDGEWGRIHVNGDLEHLSRNDMHQVVMFQRFLRGERSHEVTAWALGEPMSSANDPHSRGMGL